MVDFSLSTEILRPPSDVFEPGRRLDVRVVEGPVAVDGRCRFNRRLRDAIEADAARA